MDMYHAEIFGGQMYYHRWRTKFKVEVMNYAGMQLWEFGGFLN